MITKLKSIGSLIRRSIILADVSSLLSLPMLDSKNGKNIVVFNLIPEDKYFFYNKILLICY